MTDPQQTHLIAALLNDRDGQPALATKDGRVIVGTSDELRATFGRLAVRIVRLPVGIAPTMPVREWWTASCQDSDEAAARLAGLDRCIADLAVTGAVQAVDIAEPSTEKDDSSVAELAPPSREDDLLETAWGIIANAGEGDWNREHPEWKAAAERWRDSYLIHLRARNRLREAATSPEAPSEVESLREALETVLAKPTGLLYAKFVDWFEEPLNRDSAASAADVAASAVHWFLRQWGHRQIATEQASTEGVKSDSNLVAHARRELALIGEDQWVTDGIVSVVQAFADCGHSGGSAPYATAYLEKLLRFEPLTSLTNDPAEWADRSEQSGYPLWQNIRDSRAMSEDGGKTYWLVTDQGDAQTRPKYVAAEPGVVTRGEN